MTREHVNQFFNESVFSEFNDDLRATVLKTALLRELNAALLDEAGVKNAVTLLASLRRNSFCLLEGSDGTYRHHDLFQDFLEAQLQRQGHEAVQEAYQLACAAFEGIGNIARALDLAIEFGDSGTILRLLDSHATTLYEHGHAAILERAVVRLRSDPRVDDANIPFVAALVDIAFGRSREAIEKLRASLGEARKQPKVFLLTCYYLIGILATVECWDEVLEIAARAADVQSDDTDVNLYVWSRLCIVKFMFAKEAPTEADVDRIRKGLSSENIRTRMEVLHVFANIKVSEGRYREAREYASEALRLAEREHSYSVAGRATLTLAESAYELGEYDEFCEVMTLHEDFKRKLGALSPSSRLSGMRYLLRAEAGELDNADLNAAYAKLDGDVAERASSARHYLRGAMLYLAGRGEFARAYDLMTRWYIDFEPRYWGVNSYGFLTEDAFHYAAGGAASRAEEALREAERTLNLPGARGSASDLCTGHLSAALAYRMLGNHARAWEFIEAAWQLKSEISPGAVQVRLATDAAFRLMDDPNAESRETFKRACQAAWEKKRGGHALLLAALPMMKDALADDGTDPAVTS
jgi:ATP/maltotriose-dependent transcriptional regulator MalT